MGCVCKQVFAKTVTTMSTKSGEMEEHYYLALLTSGAERRDQNGVVLLIIIANHGCVAKQYWYFVIVSNTGSWYLGQPEGVHGDRNRHDLVY